MFFVKWNIDFAIASGFNTNGRSLRKQHFDIVMKLDAIAKETDELEMKDSVQTSMTKAKNLTDSQEFISQKFLSQYQQEIEKYLPVVCSRERVGGH